MLMKALEEAGQGKWFEVVERESLPSLLNERKIIRQTRMQYMSKEELEKIPALPAMLYAPVIFDGGVVAYESNLLTGGLGAKYLGIGGDTQFQRDNVTVALRAIQQLSASALLFFQAFFIFAPIAILGSAIDWPASLDFPPAQTLPLIQAEQAAVRLGYGLYLAWSLAFAASAALIVRLASGDEALRMQKLLDIIEELDDVQEVYHNAQLDGVEA